MAVVPPTIPETCPICQDDMTTPTCIKILNCQHKFHKDCIQKWIEISNTCPLCKRVADPSQPAREMKDDRPDLSHQLIETLIANAINPHGMNFWQQLLFGGLTGSNFSVVQSPGISMLSYTFDMDGFAPENDYETFDPFNMMTMNMNRNSDDLLSNIQTSLSQIIIPHSSVSLSPSIRGSHSPSHPSHPDFDEYKHIQGLHPRHHIRPTPLNHSCEEQAQCAYCYVISCKHRIKRCSGCKQIRYCSRRCQEDDWENHKVWCLDHRPFSSCS